MDVERLEKLDMIRERVEVTYGEADAALERNHGDVVKAIIDLENRSPMSGMKEEFWVKGNELVDQVKELIKKGNVTRIIIKSEDGKTLVEIPMTVGVVGTVLAPTLAILGGIAALVTRCKVEVERPQAAATDSRNESNLSYAYAGDPNNEEMD